MGGIAEAAFAIAKGKRQIAGTGNGEGQHGMYVADEKLRAVPSVLTLDGDSSVQNHSSTPGEMLLTYFQGVGWHP